MVIFSVMFFLTISLIIPTIVQSDNFYNINVLLSNGKISNEHLITLNSTTGIEITTDDSSPYSYQSEPNQDISIQFSRYHLRLIETEDLSTAKNVVDRIEKMEKNLLPSTEKIEKNNKTYYRVYVGDFSSMNEALQMRSDILSQTEISAIIIGSKYLSIGAFNSDALAKQKINELSNAGFSAYQVKVLDNGKWESQVWVGEAATIHKQEETKDLIQARLPNLRVSPVISDSYMIEKEVGYFNKDDLELHPLLIFPETKVVHVNPLDSKSTILVRERKTYDKSMSYRGELSLQIYNNELAVINRLPLESYLYGVVGSEMYNMWPIEALKAQAVSARTFAYNRILDSRSHVVDIYDTTADQAYYGTTKESESVIKAVDATKGIIAMKDNKPIRTFYSSNAGGITSDGIEVWGNNIPFTSVKSSATDISALENVMDWYHIVRANGQTGYMRSDFINILEAKNPAGLNYGQINDEPINFRTGPSIYRFPSMTTLPKGEVVVILDTVKENNPFSWIAGPFDADSITEKVNKYQVDTAPDFSMPILDLHVMNRGPSGRVTMLANGDTPIPVKYPDYYRTLLGSLDTGVQSTLFDIEQAGRIEVLGANNQQVSLVNKKDSIYVQSADKLTVLQETNNNQKDYMIMNLDGKVRVATKDQSYIIHGKGLGHGIGMSQWGAKGLADNGYNYQMILKYYYNDIDLIPIY